ncbi:unnamed protein product [Soboliphyme baturini]|uniref:C2H2-type domain-containing protein n=1 Tax=Soboliphyme baturini TaxID=241478 RepID=A0A183IJ23_9BILA|nr:unnamed protein product [Soboliphyme baturini]
MLCLLCKKAFKEAVVAWHGRERGRDILTDAKPNVKPLTAPVERIALLDDSRERRSVIALNQRFTEPFCDELISDGEPELFD